MSEATTTTHAIADGLEALIMSSRRQTRPYGLSATVLTTLDSLIFAGPTRVSDLAQRERVSQPGMTALVNRLEAEGLAVRQADPSDRRAAVVAVTEAGREQVAAYRHQRREQLAAGLDDLSGPHLAALEAAMPALAELVHIFVTRESSEKQ